MPRKRVNKRLKPRSKLVEQLFPHSVGRLEYLGRLLITALISIPIVLLTRDVVNFYIMLIPIILFSFWFSEIPRIRDMGWSPWIVLFELVPGAGKVFSLLLLLAPGK